ncbi:hypothetical protein ACNI65_10960 [Roseateles sp. So40a]|uniref:hypothetical protein n=1 Tax=Roseateles sp. So40a TaxID=3400226 RepID=UPI003A8881AA
MRTRIDRGVARGRIDLRLALALTLVGALLGWVATGGPLDAWDAAEASPREAPAVSLSASATALLRSEEGASAPSSAGAANEAASAANGAVSAVAASAPGAPASATGEVPAAWTLAEARTAGDERTPPLQRAAAEAQTPAWQLDDRNAYARREQDRHQSVQRAFVDAAERELPLIDQQIERGRAMGLSPEQLAIGEEKRRRIAEMQARMRASLAASGASP